MHPWRVDLKKPEQAKKREQLVAPSVPQPEKDGDRYMVKGEQCLNLAPCVCFKDE